jgi:hypothetical protein
MSRHDIDLIEAQLATSLHHELMTMEKQAFPLASVFKAIKASQPIARAAKGAATAGKGALTKGKKWGGWAAHRTTGYTGGKNLTKAQKAEWAKKHGIRGAETAPELLRKDFKAPGKLRKLFMGKEKTKAYDKLVKQYGKDLKGAPLSALKAADPKRYGKMLKQTAAESHAFRRGMTSMPGYAKSLAKNPIKTLKTGWKADSPVGRAMTVGFGGMSAYNVATAPKGEKLKTLATELPSSAIYAFGWPLGIVGQMAAAEGAAAGAGKLVGALKKTPKPPVAKAMGTLKPPIPNVPGAVGSLKPPVPNPPAPTMPGKLGTV